MSFVMITSGQVALELGARCGHDMDCQDTIRHSQCSMAGLCECKPYYAQYNDTSCVQGEFSVRFRSYQRRNCGVAGRWPRIGMYVRRMCHAVASLDGELCISLINEKMSTSTSLGTKYRKNRRRSANAIHNSCSQTHGHRRGAPQCIGTH